MLITNSSRIHRMAMFSSAQLHLSGAPFRLHPASSQQQGEERNPPLLQLSSESKPTLQLYSGAHGSSCSPDPTCGQRSHREMMAFKACHIISYHCHHFLRVVCARDAGKCLAQPLRCCRAKMLWASCQQGAQFVSVPPCFFLAWQLLPCVSLEDLSAQA